MKVLVEVGQEVEASATVCVLEAMNVRSRDSLSGAISKPVNAPKSVLVSSRWAFGAVTTICLGLSILAGIRLVPIGFNPTDDGFVLAQARRLLDGQVPHFDFISPRPVGSALLHTITFALPSPLIQTSRWIVMIEVVMATASQVWIIRRAFKLKFLSDWILPVVVLAAVVNLHTFPLMAWHTIDGLLLVSVGTVVMIKGCERGSLTLIAAGAFIAGGSLVTKQSYLPVILLIPATAAWMSASGTRLRSCLATTTVVVPAVAYLALVQLGGGRLRQLLAGGNTPPLKEMLIASPWPMTIAALSLLVMVGAKAAQARGLGCSLKKRRTIVVFSAVQAVLVMMGLSALFTSALSLRGDWAWTILWGSIAALAVAQVLPGRSREIGFLIPTFGLLAAQSWGYPKPSLVAGSLVVLLAHSAVDVWRELWRNSKTGSTILTGTSVSAGAKSRNLAAPVAVVALVALTLSLFVSTRSNTVYRDVRYIDENSDLGTITGALNGISSNSTTAAMLADVADCLVLYPTDRLAVVPDGGVIPVLFGRQNPLPLDWWYPPEIVDGLPFIADRIREAMLDPAGYLILFQKFPMADLPSITTGAATGGTGVFDYPGLTAQGLLESIPGRFVTCGAFVGRYQAPDEPAGPKH